MKKLFTLLLALVATTALWAADFEVDGIYYNILTDKTNEVEVTYKGIGAFAVRDEYTDTVVIPSTVTYKGITYNVTKIGYNAFRYSELLSAVTIPSSVVEIDEYPFVHCAYLASITVEEGNPVYNSQDACNAIIETATNTLIVGCKNTIIPSTVTKIGDWAFAGCYFLQNINLQDTMAFTELKYYDDVMWTSLTIPNTVTEIGNHAFYNCVYLESVTIPEGVKTIGNSAFQSCYSLESVTIPNSVTEILESAFAECISLRTVTLSEGLSTIAYGVFRNCRSLESVTIPRGVNEIQWDAFKNCKSLESVTIPGDVDEIQRDAFKNCKSLDTVMVSGKVVWYKNYAWENEETDIFFEDCMKLHICKKAFPSRTKVVSVK